MDEEFDTILLHCGHSINSYKSLGVCKKCRTKQCEKCLQLVDDELLCPKCFNDKVGVPR